MQILNKSVGRKDNQELVSKVHLKILSLDKKIYFKIFPIYIKYYKDDEVIGIVYFKGKFVGLNELILGLNLKSNPKLLELKNAKFMKDPDINYSFFIKSSNISNKTTKKIIELLA